MANTSNTSNTFGDLVLVVPGILGSRLARIEKGKRVPVWDLSVNRLPAALREIIGGELVFTGSGDAAPNDGIVSNGLLEIPQWIPGFFGVDGYAELVKTLRMRLGGDQVGSSPTIGAFRMHTRRNCSRIPQKAS
jgi:hypothetical protein